jgi:hypothetical protein
MEEKRMETRQELSPVARRVEIDVVAVAQQRHDERARAAARRTDATRARKASGLATLAQRHPFALAGAAGAFGLAAGWLIAGRARARSLAVDWRRLNARRDSASTTARRIAHFSNGQGADRQAAEGLARKGSPRKPHGDKLANAARAAATRTRAPTYPEG